MSKPTDIRVEITELFFLPVETRMPLKFGPETLTHVTCARVRLRVCDMQGRVADGWGETPLSVQWVWPAPLSYERRHQVLKRFCVILAQAWPGFDTIGHPLEIGHAFQKNVLPKLLDQTNAGAKVFDRMPWLAALVCCSAFDLALHDAFGNLHGLPVFETYSDRFLNCDLNDFLVPSGENKSLFTGKHPSDFLNSSPSSKLPAWHLVGGLDPLDPAELTGDEPDDGYPVLLADWIETDGLTCLKVKLRGNDPEWDYARFVKIGGIAIQNGVLWLTADFNCTVTDPSYVNEILDRLLIEYPRHYGMILYVEQPFPYELEENRIEVHGVSARKPLFLDESAHDWKMIRLGRNLGWTGVALKTCKTQTGAILSACWAKAHGMTLMVQDLTNPMLAQIPHVQLAAWVNTIMGVETNAMQFYPEASAAEARIHPGLYQRRKGLVDLSSLGGPGFGYRLDEIDRQLPEPDALFGER